MSSETSLDEVTSEGDDGSTMTGDDVIQLNSKKKKKRRKTREPTEEELLFTPEERKERMERRLKLGELCIEHCWELYHTLTQDAKRVPNSVELSPFMQRFHRYLKQRYWPLEMGIKCIKEAPAYPFIRPQKPLQLHKLDHHLSSVRVINRFLREVSSAYVPPSTFAYMERIVEVMNSNFLKHDDDSSTTLPDVCHQETQVVHDDLPAVARKVRYLDRPSTYEQLPRDLTVEIFDWEDIPIDPEGNPVGKSTGCCEWCGQEILRIPTPHMLHVTEDISTLYCCTKYQEFIEEVQEIERQLQAELDAKTFLINIRPHGKFSSTGKGGRGGSGKTSKQEGRRDSETSEEFKARKAKEKIEAAKNFLEKKKAQDSKKQKDLRVDKCVDTFDLPWDPYETVYGHPKLFPDGVFDDARSHCYPHPEIVLTQTEIYRSFPRNTKGQKAFPKTNKP